MSSACVVGSGPNGLAAAIELTKAGVEVDVVEGASTPGGGCRTEERTLPGYLHDTCSTVLALASSSPFFVEFDLAARGVQLVRPRVAFAHPLDGGHAAFVTGSVAETAALLGVDGAAYRRLFEPFMADPRAVVAAALGPPLRTIPRRPLTAARFFGIAALPASQLLRFFHTERARALLAGVSAHAIRPLTAPLTSGFGMLLTLAAHEGGWPVVAGGMSRLTDSMLAWLAEHGTQVETDRRITDLAQLPSHTMTLLDTSARDLERIVGDRLASRDRRSLLTYRHGPGVCKVDWALSGPVPWSAPACRDAGTVHVGGTYAEVAAALDDVHSGRHAPRPFCIVVQAGVVDPSRAPEGHQALWGYCHVPPGSTMDVSDAIESQIERFAPGFRDLILARRVTTALELSEANPNYVGGDISGGAATLRQTLLRPTMRWNTYRTSADGVYLCSSATPPGGGVHGMCGVGAARTALRDVTSR